MGTAFWHFFAQGGKSFGWFVCLHVFKICVHHLKQPPEGIFSARAIMGIT